VDQRVIVAFVEQNRYHRQIAVCIRVHLVHDRLEGMTVDLFLTGSLRRDRFSKLVLAAMKRGRESGVSCYL
jgi:hypothetical protein